MRSDDFLLDLPMVLAQTAHRPPFPLINRNIGSGQFMAAPIEVPVRSFVTLFRPFTWGFFIGDDIGLAWKWWGLTLGLFYSFFLVCLLVTEGRFWISFWAGLCLVFSPYVQFWSLHKAEIAIHWSTAFVCAVFLLRSSRRWVIWTAGGILGWSLAAMALDHMYPPIAVPLGWLLGVAVIAWALQHRAEWTGAPWRGHRIAAGVLAVAIAGGSLALFFHQYGAAIEAIRNTTYPGRRFSTGGNMPGWAFFSHDVFTQPRNADVSCLVNVCESASFIFTFPSVLLMAVAYGMRRGRWLNPWVPALAVFLAGVLAYTYAGFPDWLARATLFGMSTANRTQFALGMADLLMLVAALSSRQLLRDCDRGYRLLASALWLGIVAAAGLAIRGHFPELGLGTICLSVGFQGLLASLWWIWEAPALGLALLAAASFAYTAWFNPWVVGGAKFLTHNPLSREILKLDREDTGKGRWVGIGSIEFATLPRILGVKSIGGYYGCPDLKMWRRFDPEGQYAAAYNQSGYVIFQACEEGADQISSPQPGVVLVQVNPDSRAFEAAGVHYFLVADQTDARFFVGEPRFRKVFEYSGKTIFERVRSNSSGPTTGRGSAMN